MGVTVFEGLPSIAVALLIVAIVLVEAVVLYFGYGALERVVGPAVKATIDDA